jgi:acyl carrier protein
VAGVGGMSGPPQVERSPDSTQGGTGSLRQSVEKRIKEIVVKKLGVDEKEVTPNARFVDDFGADELDMVVLIMALDDAFDIEIPYADAKKLHTVQDAVDYISTHTKAGK